MTRSGTTTEALGPGGPLDGARGAALLSVAAGSATGPAAPSRRGALQGAALRPLPPSGPVNLRLPVVPHFWARGVGARPLRSHASSGVVGEGR